MEQITWDEKNLTEQEKNYSNNKESEQDVIIKIIKNVSTRNRCVDIIGKKFNKLTVISDTGRVSNSRTKIYLCKCDCGNYKEIAQEKLRHGTKSCGCLKRGNIKYAMGKDHGSWEGHEDISKSFYSRLVANASYRNYEFSLSIEDLWELFVKQNGKCALTGKDIHMPINPRKIKKFKDKRLASLDRIDNVKGYVKGNVRWICQRLNYMKHTCSEEEFLNWVKEIYEFSINKTNE